jgi:hypothetical protein
MLLFWLSNSCYLALSTWLLGSVTHVVGLAVNTVNSTDYSGNISAINRTMGPRRRPQRDTR